MVKERDSLPFPSSPCVNICTLDDANVCLGCYRHVDEIVAWARLDASERRAVIERTEQRRVQQLRLSVDSRSN